MIRIASDIGGTFTDVVLDRDGALTSIKVLSTPQRPEVGLLDGVGRVLAACGVATGEVDQFIHGTTLATNALIERRGARTAQVATAGFRDILEMAHENRFDQYDLSIDRAPPLVPRALRLEVPERVAADGRILRSLDEAAVPVLLAQLDELGVESVAITLLHAYANAAHERRLAELIQTARPSLALSVSSEVSPEIREYERFVTTCANAYVQPLMARYLTALDGALKALGFGCPLFLVTSSGDLTDFATAAAFPVRLVESGPAGGAVLAAELARRHGLDEVLAFDMGGTTAKLCLIDHGRPQTTRTFEVARAHNNMRGSGLPIRVPAIELVEIGSGGGSLARVDRLGRLLVGPRSAGAVPGPVCYARGGREPTVTDADLAMGRIDPARFSSDVTLDVSGCLHALGGLIAEPLGLDTDGAAFAISEIVDENMASAARVHAIESGKDVAARTMIAFGGAAPLHAARVAQKLGMERVLIPAQAGVGSAVGFLSAAQAFEQARSWFVGLDDFDPAPVNALMDQIAAAARALLGEGILHESRRAYMRYRGQGHEIAVDLPEGALNVASARAMREAFEARYEHLFGRAIPGVAVEALTWSVRLERPGVSARPAAAAPASVAAAATAHRDVFDPGASRRVRYEVHRREALGPGDARAGPCLITEAQTTTVCPAGFDLRVLADGSLLLQHRASLEESP